jgi:hypothetical protein
MLILSQYHIFELDTINIYSVGPFAGFSLHIVNFIGRISEAAMKGVGDIIFHNFGAQWKGTTSYCDFSPVFFLYIICRKDQRSCDRGGGGGQYIS